MDENGRSLNLKANGPKNFKNGRLGDLIMDRPRLEASILIKVMSIKYFEN